MHYTVKFGVEFLWGYLPSLQFLFFTGGGELVN